MPSPVAALPACCLPPVTNAGDTADAVRVRPGDLWQLGTHRLLCGDCTRSADVERLMQSENIDGTERADLLFTDPPYGVAYRDTKSRTLRAVRPITGDDLGEQATYDLLRQALRTAPLKPGGAFYICSPGGSNETLFRLAVRDAGLALKQSIVWVKQHFTLGRQDYQWKHESLLYGWKPGAPHYFTSDRTQTTVWEVVRPQSSPLHPTMKPVALVVQAIRNSSKPGEIVFDGFGGSGTTLLACEETGRRCRMVEIEPSCCAVILRRWEEATGRRAVRLETERPA